MIKQVQMLSPLVAVNISTTRSNNTEMIHRIYFMQAAIADERTAFQPAQSFELCGDIAARALYQALKEIYE